MKLDWQQLAREPSTYRGLVWLATAAGVVLSPDQQQGLMALGAAIAGVIGLFWTDSR